MDIDKKKQLGEHNNPTEENLVQDLKESLEVAIDETKYILVDLEQYDKYIIDASQLHVPMERSTNVSNKGNKTLFRKELF